MSYHTSLMGFLSSWELITLDELDKISLELYNKPYIALNDAQMELTVFDTLHTRNKEND